MKYEPLEDNLRIARLEMRVNDLWRENRRLRKGQVDAHTPIYGSETAYIMGLIGQIASLEKAFDQLNKDFAALLEDNKKKTAALESFNVVSPQESI